MEIDRKPFQGIINIIRFNWHYYFISGLILFSLFFIKQYLPEQIQGILILFIFITSFQIVFSLLVSYYIYDFSDLFQFNYLLNIYNKKILNINAGFDETSNIIKNKFPNCELTICDFYNSEKHTEVSIKRARKTYPPNEKTIKIESNQLPFSENSFDTILVILSAHEIREEKERVEFFKELNRILMIDGQIYITEHLKNFSNFIAFSIGFFHFFSKSTWLKTFKEANLNLVKELKTTPFITTFILEKYGNTN